VTLNPKLRIAGIFLIGVLLGTAATLVFMRPTPVVQVLTPAPAPPPQVAYEPRTFTELAGWDDDRLADILPALTKSCARIKDEDEPQSIGKIAISAADRKAACQKVLDPALSKKELRAAFEAAYQPYAVIASGKAEGTFTGYYEATLNGSLQREGPYQFPLYGVPKKLISVALKDFVSPSALEGGDLPRTLVGRVDGQQLKPFYTREEIDLENAIAEDSTVVAWIDDAVDVHVLHIQGSGQVTLPDGSMMRVGFAGHNGHSFRGLGRILIDEGVLPQGTASMIAVRDWLKQSPKRAQELMVQNARYIFFRKIEGDGPIGASGLALTPGRSLAVDPRYVPLGSLLWLQTTDPDRNALRRLMVAQDTGAAITGVVRGDYFWGAGEPAFAKAARMRSPGRYDILVPKPASSNPPSAP
jgi:membrane-bound lytic murein transglycosylase A